MAVCIELLKALDELCLLTAKETIIKKSTPAPTLHLDSNSLSTFFDLNKVNSLKAGVGSLSSEERLKLVEKVRQQQIESQKLLTEISEDLKWLNRSFDLANTNQAAWHNLKKLSEQKIKEASLIYRPTESDDTIVQLNEICLDDQK